MEISKSPGRIKVEAPTDEGEVLVSISDKGIGLSPTVCQRIFGQ